MGLALLLQNLPGPRHAGFFHGQVRMHGLSLTNPQERERHLVVTPRTRRKPLPPAVEGGLFAPVCEPPFLWHSADVLPLFVFYGDTAPQLTD